MITFFPVIKDLRLLDLHEILGLACGCEDNATLVQFQLSVGM